MAPSDVVSSGLPQRGGVLVRAPGSPAAEARLWFVPAEQVVEVVSLGAVTRAPGLRPPAVGLALARGVVVTVLDVGGAALLAETATGEDDEPAPDSAAPSTPLRSAFGDRYRAGEDWPMPGSDRAVLCDVGGEAVAISGGSVIATGAFDAALRGDGVLWRGRRVPRLDVRALYARAEAAIWAARAAARPRAGAK